jgi:hypothetical protein
MLLGSVTDSVSLGVAIFQHDQNGVCGHLLSAATQVNCRIAWMVSLYAVSILDVLHCMHVRSPSFSILVTLHKFLRKEIGGGSA